MWGTPIFLKSSMLTLFCGAEITVVTATVELRSLNTMRVIGSQGGRNQVLAVNCKIRGGHAYCKGW